MPGQLLAPPHRNAAAAADPQPVAGLPAELSTGRLPSAPARHSAGAGLHTEPPPAKWRPAETPLWGGPEGTGCALHPGLVCWWLGRAPDAASCRCEAPRTDTSGVVLCGKMRFLTLRVLIFSFVLLLLGVVKALEWE